MAPPSGSAAYKTQDGSKKDGTLTMSQDGQSVSWIPAAGGASQTVTLPVSQITSASAAFALF
jgi:transcription initiation factor TFIIH subunit 1